MATMLRRSVWLYFGCCSRCDRHKRGRKGGPRHRHAARAAEKRQWLRDPESA